MKAPARLGAFGLVLASPGPFRLFLASPHEGVVRTVAFTGEIPG